MSLVPSSHTPWLIWPRLPEVSAHAAHLDWMMVGFAVLISLFTIPVFLLLAYFSIKYRRGNPVDRSNRPSGNMGLETAWSVIPFLAVLGFFIWAAWDYINIRTPPSDAMEIDVDAKQWMWKFQHPGGQREINTLHVPVGRPVKLVMISEDVIHDLFLPALRIKQDVLPGRYTTLWFTATETGDFDLRCSQFCGTEHSYMTGMVSIMTPTAFAAWLANQGVDAPLVASGRTLFVRLGCSGCHDSASKVRAPSLNGLLGRPVRLSSGQVITADDRFIRDSILESGKEPIAGYDNTMPNYAGAIDEATLTQLVAYIKSLPANPAVQP